ncbi:hypothetical protein TanjilG_07829 [Lupinus angustifolius]|uniref:Uncharacterized protein n=1 Tax=Lupinus angustifolius TaxID=3871 RepID=A0A394DPG6_LUPAN|nr:hypothetical protein TanjilG_07829 [Lupinus angustifolius]
MSGNVHVRLREKGDGQKWSCCTSLSSLLGSALFVVGRVCQYDLNEDIIPKYSKDSNIVNEEGGQTLAEFPNSIELGKFGPGQDPNNKVHSTTSLVVFFLLVAAASAPARYERPDERSTELHPYSPGPFTSLSPGGWPPILGLPIFKRIPGSIWLSIKVIL